MKIGRWVRLVSLAIMLWANGSHAATIYSSPMLNEANNLVDIVPAQAKQIAQHYLIERQLSERATTPTSSMSREETDSRLRTPGSSIDAFNILAQAEFNLGHQNQALQALDQASNLAKNYNLPYLSLDIRFLRTRILWKIHRQAEMANQSLNEIEQGYNAIKKPDLLARNVRYKLQMLRAEIASETGDLDAANKIYQALKPEMEQDTSANRVLDFHIAVGEHWLRHQYYNRALSELLRSYWLAIEENNSIELANINRLLASLFYDRQVLDKALDHLSQAADFYDSYEQSPILAQVLKMMGDIYYQQGKYNLALVHYFNVLDHEQNTTTLSNLTEVRKSAEIRIALANTYLQLYNFPLTQHYLEQVETLLVQLKEPDLQAQVLLLHAGLDYYQNSNHQVVDYAEQALKIAQSLHNIDLEQQAYQILALGYEQEGHYHQALSHLKHFTSLKDIQQDKLNQISEDAFRQQKDFVEHTLHLTGQQAELTQLHHSYKQFQNIAAVLLIVCIVLTLLVLRRGYTNQRQKEQIQTLNKELFAHSRSGLRNLRMLSAHLPQSLQASSRTFERWQAGDLIQEPLHDRLKFVMVDLPFLRNIYLHHGYSEGLKLEQAFGAFLRQKMSEHARIYHFSDTNLLYIEPASDDDQSPETLFQRIQNWVEEFEPSIDIDRSVRVGMADYPFLPRAYTAINDKELLDILLVATHMARLLSRHTQTSQWVYLKAIEYAPAASFATGDIRAACKQAITQGLIKAHTSCQNDECLQKLLQD